MIQYLMRLWHRLTVDPMCPYCGERWPNQQAWLIHVGHDHPPVAESILSLYRERRKGN